MIVVYSPKFDEYGIPIRDGGSSTVRIAYCPWCGRKLPDSRRDLWFTTLNALGFSEPFSQSIPSRFETDEWWRVVISSLTWHVMDALADDWESIEQIRPCVLQFVGATPDEEIFRTLRMLHDSQYIRLMNDSGNADDCFPDDPSHYWFSMTDAGRAIWDDEGVLFRGEYD